MNGQDLNTETVVHCPPFANESIYWRFGRHRGWSRVDQEGPTWQYCGPLDRFGKRYLLRHFGLEEMAKDLTVRRLRKMRPSELRALKQRSQLTIAA